MKTRPTSSVRVSLDKDAKTLTISRQRHWSEPQEAIDNLGTIAKSGTREFMSSCRATRSPTRN
jgi:molecular chaperone HtpG